MSYDYSENILVQESTGHLLADELGWQVELAYNQEILGKNGTFGRSSYKDILLVRYFQKALRTLNPWITDAQVIEAQNTFEKHLSSASLMQINEEKYAYIRDGIPVTEKKPNGQTEEKRAMIIDFQHPDDMERNHFLAVKEMKIHGDLYRRRTDIVGFVNGIPLLFVELKKNSVDVQNAYTDNYTDYLDTIPQLFYYNAFLMLSNGVEAKVGKGIGGTSTDAECSQVAKHRRRREKEHRDKEILPIYIVNHQRYIRPSLRQNPPFSDNQIDYAKNDERGLLTTWQLYNQYKLIENGIFTKKETR